MTIGNTGAADASSASRLPLPPHPAENKTPAAATTAKVGRQFLGGRDVNTVRRFMMCSTLNSLSANQLKQARRIHRVQPFVGMAKSQVNFLLAAAVHQRTGALASTSSTTDCAKGMLCWDDVPKL
jgi:hypothetical protein